MLYTKSKCRNFVEKNASPKRRVFREIAEKHLKLKTLQYVHTALHAALKRVFKI